VYKEVKLCIALDENSKARERHMQRNVNGLENASRMYERRTDGSKGGSWAFL
jgi:hypothetical protein